MSEDLQPGPDFFIPDERALHVFGRNRINELNHGKNMATPAEAEPLANMIDVACQDGGFTSFRELPALDGEGTHTRITSKLVSFEPGYAGEGVRVTKYDDGPVEDGLFGDRASVAVDDPRPALIKSPKEAIYIDRETGVPWIARSVDQRVKGGEAVAVAYKPATPQELDQWMTKVAEGVRQRDEMKAMSQTVSRHTIDKP